MSIAREDQEIPQNPLTAFGWLQSRFRAYDNLAVNVFAAPGGIIIFDAEDFDGLGEYNQATGVFTAAAAGYYLFHSTVIVSHNDINPLGVGLLVNCSVYGFAEFDLHIIPVATQEQIETTTIIELAAGETVVMSIFHAGGAGVLVTVVAGTPWCNFKGHRLS